MSVRRSAAREAAQQAPSILFLADSLGCGGSERQLVELACELHRGGLRVAVASYRPDDFFAPRLDDAGIRRVKLPRGGWRDVAFVGRLRATMRGFGLVHPFRPGPSFWAALARRTLPPGERPILVAAERSWGTDAGGLRGRIFRWAFRQAAAVTVNNAVAKRRMERLVAPAVRRVELIANGIDLARWDAAASGACPLPLDAERFELAVVGSFRPEKNQPLAIEAFARVPAEVRSGWRLWLIGDASLQPRYLERVRQAVAAHGLERQVRISPAVADIAPVMRRLSALLLPSTREGFPNVALEAMASRVPVIGARVGAMGDLVEDGRTGLLVEGYEPDAWAAAVTRLAALAPEERAALGRRARARVEAELQMERIGARYRRLYEEL